MSASISKRSSFLSIGRWQHIETASVPSSAYRFAAIFANFAFTTDISQKWLPLPFTANLPFTSASPRFAIRMRMHGRRAQSLRPTAPYNNWLVTLQAQALAYART
jgi:hypothetical protein